MQMTVVGTVWRCEANTSDEATDADAFTVEIVEYLPGHITDKGPEGQAVKLTLDSAEELKEGAAYRITANVTTILPTQEGDDLYVLGDILDAKLIE